MTILDKPNSRLQKYRVTGKGQKFLIGLARSPKACKS